MTLQLSNFSRKNEVTAALCFDEPDTRAVLWNPVNGEWPAAYGRFDGYFPAAVCTGPDLDCLYRPLGRDGRCAADYRLPGERRTGRDARPVRGGRTGSAPMP